MPNLIQPDPEPRPWVVLDTNVVLDIWLFHDQHTQTLRLALESGVLRSARLPVMLDELADVLGRPFTAGRPTTPETVLQHARDMSECSPVAVTKRGPLRCADPDDQVFIDLALALPARWLFSRDRALLALARQAAALGVTILRPCDWAWPELPLTPAG